MKEAALLASLRVSNSFSVPEGYFDDLSERINVGVYAEQLRSVNSGLAVPDGYFDNLRSDILAKTVQEQKAPKHKIVRLWHSNLLKYASAACFILVAGTGYYFNQQRNVQPVNTPEMATEQMLFDIDEQVIIDHIEETASAQPIVNADDAAMENYILSNYSQSDLVTDL